MGCGISTAAVQPHQKGPLVNEKKANNGVKEQSKQKAKERSDSSSSSDSSDSSSDDDEVKRKEKKLTKKKRKKDETLTRTLLKEYLKREIDMLKLELTQPEVVLAQLLKAKDKNLEEHTLNKSELAEQTKICQVEYRDLTNLQALAKQTHIDQSTWAKEQQEYVVVYNKYLTLEETYKRLHAESADLDTLILQTSNAVQSLLKLRKHQDHVLVRTFDGSYGSAREAEIEEHVDKLRDFKKNVMQTKSQWDAGMTYTKHANEQFWKASQIWNGILKQGSPHVRMQQCQAVHNYLRAALTNIDYALYVMKGHTQVPYFTPKLCNEITVSTRSVYSACTPHYHAQFYEWLVHYQQNAAYLQQWIEKTLSQTIEGDVIKVNSYLAIAETDLREERKKLILEKMKDKFGDEAESEVNDQDEEVKRLTAQLKEMHSIAIQTNTVSSIEHEAKIKGSPEDVPAPTSDPPTHEKLQQRASIQKIAVDHKVQAEIAAKEAEVRAKETAMLAQEQEEQQAKAEAEALAKAEQEAEAAAAEELSRKTLEEARAKEAAAAAEAERLTSEQAKLESDKAQSDMEEKRRLQEEATNAKIAADLAAADAAEDVKDQALAEAAEATRKADEAKAEALKWEEMAKQAAEKAKKELDEAAAAAAARTAAQSAAAEAEEVAKKAKEALEKAAEEAAAAKEAQKVKDEAAKKAKEDAKEAELERKRKEEETALSTDNPDQPEQADVTITFQTDVESIMNGYRASVEQYEKKRGTEEARMDLDLQDKLRERRKRRRQQMKQKIQEQKLAAEQSKTVIEENEA